ncbi:MAG: GDSL-type esterase/lipase family protein [Victivallales bacterium]
MSFRTTVLGMAVAALSSATFAGDGSCFIKDGDKVGFFGDSITDAKAYGQITELVFRHFHPDAKVTFVNNGRSGLQLAGTKVEDVIKGDPNVVTIMMGMNDAINASWVRGMPIEPKIAEYKANLVKLVRDLKERNKVVVLFTPTLTEESAEASAFRIEGTRLLMEAMGKACEEVAKEESVHCVPVQSEFESYQDSLPRFAQLRPDGVHPCARGHYQIARSTWTHMNLAGPLEGGRAVSPASQALDVNLSLASNIIPADSDSLEFTITTPKPLSAKLTWSSGQARGAESLNLAGKNAWTLKLPKDSLPQADGKAVSLVMDIESQGARQIFVVDVFRRIVIHGKDGKASGNIADEKGTQVCSYLFKKDGKGLLFEASVKKKEIFHNNDAQWPWGAGDAMTLYLDIRKNSDIGGLGFDGNVYQVWFKPQDKPFFSAGFHPWSGKHMSNIAADFGEKTADGYKVGLQLAGYFNITERLDMTDRDFIGFDLSIVYAEAANKQTWINLQKTERQNFIYPAVLVLIDLDGKMKGDSIFTASVFPDNLK